LKTYGEKKEIGGKKTREHKYEKDLYDREKLGAPKRKDPAVGGKAINPKSTKRRVKKEGER